MKLRNLRWWIVGLLLMISIKNYVDRQMFSLLAPTIQADLHMSDAQYGKVISFFLAAYTIAYLLSGRLVDAIGARTGLGLFLVVWSIASAMTGWARSFVSVSFWRGLLGLGEAGGYTASPKVVSEWFPDRERGTAVSLYAMGASVGATLAPVLTIWLAGRYGWRATFCITGLFGLALAVPWIFLFRPLVAHPWLRDEERVYIVEGQSQASEPVEAKVSERERWRAIFASPAIWALMVARMLTDPVWYFFQFWLPKYLHTDRGFSQAELSSLWLIFLAADAGFIGGGLISDWLVRRGYSSPEARRRIMAIAAIVIPLTAPFIPALRSTPMLFLVAMCVALAHTAWLTCNATYVLDLVPRGLFSTVFGFISAGSSLGGILMNQGVAWAITHYSYAYCFYAMVLLHPLAFALIWSFARRPVAVRSYDVATPKFA